MLSKRGQSTYSRGQTFIEGTHTKVTYEQCLAAAVRVESSGIEKRSLYHTYDIDIGAREHGAVAILRLTRVPAAIVCLCVQYGHLFSRLSYFYLSVSRHYPLIVFVPVVIDVGTRSGHADVDDGDASGASLVC